MENQATSSSEKPTSQVERIVAVVQPIAQRLEAIVGRVRGMIWVYAGGAVLLWGLLFLPFTSDSIWFYGWIAVVLICLLVPSGILLLFYFGLKAVIRLPGRLLEKAGVGEGHARTIVESARLSNQEAPSRRAGKVMLTLFEMRSLILESKNMLLEYAVLMRMANPFLLGIVGVAVVAGFFILSGAFIGLLFVAL